MYFVSFEKFFFDDLRMYFIIKKYNCKDIFYIKLINNLSLLIFEILKKCINLYLYLFLRKDIDVILLFVY